ncbi:hypothetical protein ABIF21_000157 [Bradyrhizobium elkanii]|uniref:hypothetical protein n=1 Tax=Bradyrhizobium elkanii TaxID=29448 RepID=UPI00101FB6B2|nr:hypothetical protein [Bradyrhizobium elkanii]NWL37251.1 hypothetical protein [Bradyrhizobium elkanii]RYM19369.1 hypothetical protein EWH13_28845 [Bradyrhizobium elkanii]
MANDEIPKEPNFVPAPLPERYDIPTAIIEQWFEIPAQARVQFPLTRADIDHLIIGLLWTLDAQSKMDAALTAWSNGDLNGANKAIFESRRINIEAQNRIRQLGTALMASAIRERRT